MGTMVAVKAEFVWIFVLFNGFVHTIMYLYYMCSGVGIKLRMIRPFITSMQIVQFYTGIFVHWSLYSTATKPGGACTHTGSTWCFHFQLVYVVAVLLFFSLFFVGQYLRRERKHRHSK